MLFKEGGKIMGRWVEDNDGMLRSGIGIWIIVVGEMNVMKG